MNVKVKKKKKKNTVLESPMQIFICVYVQELRSKIPKKRVERGKPKEMYDFNN